MENRSENTPPRVLYPILHLVFFYFRKWKIHGRVKFYTAAFYFTRPWVYIAWKVSKYGVFSSPYFPVFGLNTKIYGVDLRIQSEYRKIQTRKNSVFAHFPRIVTFLMYSLSFFHSCQKWFWQMILNCKSAAV